MTELRRDRVSRRTVAAAVPDAVRAAERTSIGAGRCSRARRRRGLAPGRPVDVPAARIGVFLGAESGRVAVRDRGGARARGGRRADASTRARSGAGAARWRRSSTPPRRVAGGGGVGARPATSAPRAGRDRLARRARRAPPPSPRRRARSAPGECDVALCGGVGADVDPLDARRLRAAGGALSARGCSRALRRAPRRLRRGRGRGGRGAGGRARPGPRRARRGGALARRLPPDRARSRTATAPSARCAARCADAGDGARRLRAGARHLDAAQRRGRGGGDPAACSARALDAPRVARSRARSATGIAGAARSGSCAPCAAMPDGTRAADGGPARARPGLRPAPRPGARARPSGANGAGQRVRVRRRQHQPRPAGVA